MSDIFREVDEDLRHDRYRKLWDRWAPFIIGGAVLIVLVTAGYRGWDWWQQSQAAQAGDRFLAAVEASQAGDRDKAIELLNALEADGPGGYPTLAELRIAGEKAAEGDTEAAVAAYDAIAAKGGLMPEIRNVARMRAAILLVDTSTLEEVETRIGDLAATGNPWRHTARELLGLTAWRLGEYEVSRDYFTQISVDQEAPSGTRQRAQVMLGLIEARIGAPADAAS